MKSLNAALAAAVLLLGVSAPAMASAPVQDGDGDDYTFTLYNNSSSTVVTFHLIAQNDSDWSEDLIPSDVIAPGDELYMEFSPSEDECYYATSVTLDDGTELADVLNYCGIDGVAVDDDGIRSY